MIPPTPSTTTQISVEPELRARGDVEDDVADVDEPADRRQDAERELQEALHAPASSSAVAAARSSSARRPAASSGSAAASSSRLRAV